MSTVLLVFGAAAYAVAALYPARWLYGTSRARAIDNAPRYRRDPVEWFNDCNRPFYIAGALAAALFWPLVLPAWWLARSAGRFFDDTPIRSRFELDAEREAQAQRIRELERELTIR